MHLLSAGEQSKAEAKIAEALKLQPPDPRFVFLDAVCTRSRFEVSAAAKGFRQTMAMAPESTDALAAAFLEWITREIPRPLFIISTPC